MDSSSLTTPQQQQQQLNDDDAAVAAAEAAIPAAEPVEQGRLLVEDDPISSDQTTSNKPNNTPKSVVSTTTTTTAGRRQLLLVDRRCDDAPASPDSFNADELFENVLLIGDSNVDNNHSSSRITDQELENLLLSEDSHGNGGNNLPYLLPSRRTVRVTSLETSIEEEENDDDDSSSNDEHDTDNNNDDDNNNNNNNEPRNKKKKRRYPKKRRMNCHCCPSSITLMPCSCSSSSNYFSYAGNMIIVLPKCYTSRLRFGIIGPHWFGPICTTALLTSATIYYVSKAFNNIGPISSIICLLFYTIALASLLIVSCTDPGIVRAGGLDNAAGRHSYSGLPTSDMTAQRGWRYCDLCSVYQPPNAVHCPECNVCIEGYDHHCPWMGMCIGGRNFRAFMVFNISWLLYLLYVIVWVVICGPHFGGLVE